MEIKKGYKLTFMGNDYIVKEVIADDKTIVIKCLNYSAFIVSGLKKIDVLVVYKTLDNR